MLLAVAGDRQAFHQLHHDVRPPIAGDPAVEQAGDVGMFQSGEDLPLQEKAGQHHVRVHAPAQQFDRRPLLELAVGPFRQQHRPHAAGADGTEDSPGTDPFREGRLLLQGGHNPALPLDYYLELVRETRRRFPSVTPHFFSASEILTMSEVAGKPVPEVLTLLKQAGQTSIPGGGAEVLSERTRRRIEPKKGGPEAWLVVHREAHRQGFRSTATMMYGKTSGSATYRMTCQRLAPSMRAAS